MGVVGGIPAGIIPAQQSVNYDNYNFIVAIDIRNIDDPFDGTFPTDTAPADYKLAQLSVSCPACQNFNPLALTTTLAPKGLESATNQGSLFVNVFDSNGHGIASANVNVVNPNVTPAMNLTDTTNASGTLQLVGVPTSTQGYQIFVSRPGYSSAQSYPIGGAGNPDPTQPNITVAQGQLSTASFAIDRISALTVSASNNVCAGIPATGFSITGSKTIGAPNVLKFATTSAMNGSGAALFPNMEWDTYALALTSSSYDLLGTMPLAPLTINPSSTLSFNFVLAPKIPKSLEVTAVDAATGAGVAAASIKLSGNSFSQTLVAGQSSLTGTDWSNGNYAVQSGGIDADGAPGSVSLLLNASGTYDTSVSSWLVSNTMDFGTSSANFVSLNANPAAEPPSTGTGSAEFQLAANNDTVTWNFAGPSGAGSFYDSSSTITGLNGYRYLRYKIFLSTQDPNVSPTVNDVAIGFSSPCLPPAQVLFSGLSAGSYTTLATAPNYREATSSASVSANSQSAQILMTHQ